MREKSLLELGDDYSSEFEAAAYMQIPNGYGEHVKRLTEAAHNTIHRLYQNALDKRKYSDEGEEEVLDAKIRRFATREIPDAFEDVGEHISQAREFEKNISEDSFFGEGNETEWRLSMNERPEKEQEFLENYRRAETQYRSLFEALDNPVSNDETLIEFVEEEYDINLQEIIPEVPEPRNNLR